MLRKQETAAFLTSLAGAYKANPYHNSVHAATVASAFLCMIQNCRRLSNAPLGSTDMDSAEVLNRSACERCFKWHSSSTFHFISF